MSRRNEILLLRASGYKWNAIANMLGISRTKAHQIAALKPEWKQATIGNMSKAPKTTFDGIAQIENEGGNGWAGISREEEAEMDARIALAKQQLKEKHFAEMRNQ